MGNREAYLPFTQLASKCFSLACLASVQRASALPVMGNRALVLSDVLKEEREVVGWKQEKLSTPSSSLS